MICLIDSGFVWHLVKSKCCFVCVLWQVIDDKYFRFGGTIVRIVPDGTFSMILRRRPTEWETIELTQSNCRPGHGTRHQCRSSTSKTPRIPFQTFPLEWWTHRCDENQPANTLHHTMVYSMAINSRWLCFCKIIEYKNYHPFCTIQRSRWPYTVGCAVAVEEK